MNKPEKKYVLENVKTPLRYDRFSKCIRTDDDERVANVRLYGALTNADFTDLLGEMLVEAFNEKFGSSSKEETPK